MDFFHLKEIRQLPSSLIRWVIRGSVIGFAATLVWGLIVLFGNAGNGGMLKTLGGAVILTVCLSLLWTMTGYSVLLLSVLVQDMISAVRKLPQAYRFIVSLPARWRQADPADKRATVLTGATLAAGAAVFALLWIPASLIYYGLPSWLQSRDWWFEITAIDLLLMAAGLILWMLVLSLALGALNLIRRARGK